jgi:catechol 2,3-dioxygenase-like lactoylglutathione lyase family enzyme
MGLTYTTIRVTDLKKSTDFYTKYLGMKIEGRRSWVPGERIVMLVSKDTGQHLNLIHFARGSRNYSAYKTGSEMDHLMFEVDDAKKLYEKLVAKGAPVAMKLWEDEGMALGFVKDPDGIWIGLRSGKR